MEGRFKSYRLSSPPSHPCLSTHSFSLTLCLFSLSWFKPLPQSACVLCLIYKMKVLLQLFVFLLISLAPSVYLSFTTSNIDLHNYFSYCNYLATFACVFACFSLTCMFRTCSIISVLMIPDDSRIPFPPLQSQTVSSQRCHLVKV